MTSLGFNSISRLSYQPKQRQILCPRGLIPSRCCCFIGTPNFSCRRLLALAKNIWRCLVEANLICEFQILKNLSQTYMLTLHLHLLGQLKLCSSSLPFDNKEEEFKIHSLIITKLTFQSFSV